MKITKEDLRHMIKEELNEMAEMSMAGKLAGLLNNDDPQMIMTGFEIASMLSMPIVIRERPPREILHYIRDLNDPQLLTLMAEPQTHKLIQAKVAQNQNTPIEVIYKMATNTEYNIRAANYAKQGLEVYCGQFPEHEFCKSLAIDIGFGEAQ